MADFAEKYGSREILDGIGWVNLPELDCAGLETCSELSSQAVQKDFGRSVKNAWFTRPMAVENQELFMIKEEILRSVVPKKA